MCDIIIEPDNVIDGISKRSCLQRSRTYLEENAVKPEEERSIVTLEFLEKLVSVIGDKQERFEGASNRSEVIREIVRQLQTEVGVTHNSATCLDTGNDFIPWFDEFRLETPQLHFWDAYRQYLSEEEGFPPTSVLTIDKDTDTIMDHVGNPKDSRDSWDYRGMVIGHVQSGKTANFTGVINKAVDSGYKLIVVFTGMLESLRVQTQERLKHGFAGVEKTTTGYKVIGAGLFADEINKRRSSRRPISQTDNENDFTGKVGMPAYDLSQINPSNPVFMVCKKNTHVLRNLNKWLESQKDQLGAFPVLILDDECDNASVNTKPGENEFTAINGGLRKLLQLCPKSSYVGFTATPFANIFIEDQTQDLEDLFPKDFILTVNAPDNYVGYQRLFMSPNEEVDETAAYGDLAECIVEIDEDNLFPLKHQNEEIKNLTPDLEKAILNFILALAIRKSQGAGDKHGTMMVHASRFTIVQKSLKGLIYEFIQNRVKPAISSNCKLGGEGLRNPIMEKIYSIYNDTYNRDDWPEWESIQESLDVVSEIKIEAYYHRSNEKVGYPTSRAKKVIAIGGPSVARGITLEGLLMSFFYRFSKTYDTMTQMARWFGYRNGFEKLCRVYLTTDAAAFFSYIGLATDELRNDVERMKRTGGKPVDFGMKVRNHPASMFTVTARNKMLRSENSTMSIDLAGRLVESVKLPFELADREGNKAIVENLLRSLGDGLVPHKLGWGCENVPVKCVVEFLETFDYVADSTGFDRATPLTVDYITEASKNNLWKEFNVVVRAKSSKGKRRELNLEEGLNFDNAELMMRESTLKKEVVNGRHALVSTNRRIGAVSDELFGLTELEIASCKKTSKKGKLITDVDAIRELDDRKPLLVINPFIWKSPEGIEVEPNYSYSLIFPHSKHKEICTVQYVINRVHAQQTEMDFEECDE